MALKGGVDMPGWGPRITGAVVIVGLVVLGVVLTMIPRRPVPQPAPEVADKRLGPADHEKEIQNQLDGVRKFDQELAARVDMPDDEIAKAPTVKLLDHFVNSPMQTWLTLYPDSSTGVRRAIQGSPSLYAFTKRPDQIQAMIEWNRQRVDDINQLKPPSEKGGAISSSLMSSDTLLSFPDISKHVAGHERELLGALCARYRAMIDANGRFDEDSKPFGASFNSTKSHIQNLAKSIDPQQNWDVEDAELISRAEKLAAATPKP